MSSDKTSSSPADSAAALGRLMSVNRAARIQASACWTIKRLHRVREDFGVVFDWAGEQAGTGGEVAALAAQARGVERQLREVEAALGDPALGDDEGPAEDSVLGRLLAVGAQLPALDRAAAAAFDFAALAPELAATESSLDRAIGHFEKLAAGDLPALGRACDTFQAVQRDRDRETALRQNVADIAACICTFPCAGAPYTGETPKDFSSSSGGASFTVKAAGSNARRVDVECTVRTSARRGKVNVYVSTDANLNLTTSGGPYVVEGAGPKTFRVFGCIGGFGGTGTFRIYDLISIAGLRYRVSVTNR